MNPEFFTPHDDTENAAQRDDLVDAYLENRNMSYDKLIETLRAHGGEVLPYDSEQLQQLCTEFTAGTQVQFSAQQFPHEYQPGLLVDDAFLVPLANIDHQPRRYRPRLCATVEDAAGITDVILFPIAAHSDGHLEVVGLSKQ